MPNITDQTKSKMAAAIDHLKNELKSIRTGRANPGMLDGVVVEAYGAQMRIKELASITTPEPSQIVISPFDQNNKGIIAKSIEKANLGNPIIDGNVIRIKIPAMDQNRRKEMVKLCHKKLEEAKVSIRNIRRESNDALRKLKSEGTMAEDEANTLEKKIQEQTDKHCKEADECAEKKEREVMTI